MGQFVQDDFFQNLNPLPDARVFLGWQRPLVELAAEFLLARSAPARESLVIVPTRQSARRLRDGMRSLAPGQSPPTIATPEALYSPPETVEPRIASEGETLLAWTLTLQATRLGDLRNLFPIDPPERGFMWAMGTAADLLKLRSTLGEAALLMRDVPEKLVGRFADAPRWRELARLETEAAARLEAAGLADAASVRQHLAGSPALPPEINDIVLVGLPDPPGIALRALEQLTQTHRVSVAVYAPESAARRFDPWGRPTETGWAGARIDIDDDAIHLCADPIAQADAAADLLAGSPRTALSLADPDLTAPLQSALTRRGIASHLPAGRPLVGHELYALLRLLADLLETRAFAPAAELARHPDLLAAAAASYAPPADAAESASFDLTSALRDLDSIAVDHLPATFADAVHFAHRKRRWLALRHLLEHIGGWLERLSSEPLTTSLPAFLEQTFAAREFEPGAPEGADFAAVTEKLSTLLMAGAPLAGARFGNADALRLALAVLRGEALPEPRADSAIDLQGWLESLWDGAPRLVLIGANEGRLPESMGGDPFLPNRSRKPLGIRDSNARLVRDSYLLTAMIESRRGSGRVDLILGRTTEDGDPLRPSRLLFRCPDGELPARALRLCSGDELKPPPAPAWRAAWQLEPPPSVEGSKIREQISVTGFRSYLACPFRYYLSAGLDMEELDSAKLEMDARDFGIVCHHALEKFGEHETLRDSTDPDSIREFLIAQLDDAVAWRYGRLLSVALAFQLESAKQRLAWAAEIQAKERAAGWRIVDTEWKIHGSHDWRLGGLAIRGTIDRIERHERDGIWRVLDYKTSAAARAPQEAHWRGLKPGEHAGDLAPWATLESGGTTRRWTDLQVPLYVLALRELLGAETVSAGYFNLARSAAETGIQTWDGLDPPTLEAARACAEGVAGAVRAGVFWPPAAAPQYDDYHSILFGDAAALSLPPKLEPAAGDHRP